MKGIFKGFRYISNIFEPTKEQELQIGFPTDVKHVAHIGWDGPSVTPPSWMNDFKSAPLTGLGTDHGTEFSESNAKFPSHDLSSGTSDTHSKDAAENSIPKPSRRHRSITESPLDSPAREGGSHHGAPKPSRRHANSVDAADPSATHNTTRHSRRNKSSECLDPSSGEGSTRRGRRSSRAKEPQAGSESPDLPSIPKHGKKKKSKGGGSSVGEGSSRRAKAQAPPDEERASTASASDATPDATPAAVSHADEVLSSVTTMPTIEEEHKTKPVIDD